MKSSLLQLFILSTPASCSGRKRDYRLSGWLIYANVQEPMGSSSVGSRPDDGNGHLFVTVNRSDFSSSPSMGAQVLSLSTYVTFTFHRLPPGRPDRNLYLYISLTTGVIPPQEADQPRPGFPYLLTIPRLLWLSMGSACSLEKGESARMVPGDHRHPSDFYSPWTDIQGLIVAVLRTGILWSAILLDTDLGSQLWASVGESRATGDGKGN
jgi:hypothetical protein